MFHVLYKTYIYEKGQCFISMFRKLYIHMFHTYPIHPDSDRDNYQCFSNPFFYLPSIYHRFKNDGKTSMLDSALAKHQAFQKFPSFRSLHNLHPGRLSEVTDSSVPSSWIPFHQAAFGGSSPLPSSVASERDP